MHHLMRGGRRAGVWLHGEAVSAGTVMAADMSYRLGWIERDILDRTVRLLERAKLPVAAPAVRWGLGSRSAGSGLGSVSPLITTPAVRPCAQGVGPFVQAGVGTACACGARRVLRPILVLYVRRRALGAHLAPDSRCQPTLRSREALLHRGIHAVANAARLRICKLYPFCEVGMHRMTVGAHPRACHWRPARKAGMPAATGAPVSSCSPCLAHSSPDTHADGRTGHDEARLLVINAVDEKVRDGELRLMLGDRPLAESLPQQHPRSSSTQQQL